MDSRLCSHKGIDNKGKIDKGKKDNIKLIIASENTTKSFETAKKPLNLIALSVQLLIIVPRIFTVAFRRDYGYVTKFRRQRPRIVSFVCRVHQKIDWLVNRTKTSQQGAAFRSIAAVSRRQRKRYPIPICEHVLDYAVKMGAIQDNPCRRVTLPPLERNEKEVYTLEEAQQRLLLGDRWTAGDRLFTNADGGLMHPNTPYKWLKEFCDRTGQRFLGIHAFGTTKANPRSPCNY